MTGYEVNMTGYAGVIDSRIFLLYGGTINGFPHRKSSGK